MSSNQTAAWEDREGRVWSCAITVNSIKRVRDLAGVDLLDAFDGQLFERLADDPVLLVNVLYVVCQPQADERRLTDEQFGELLVGDTIEVAAESLVRGLIDFFPPDRRTVLERLWAATEKVRAEVVKLAMEKLDSTLFDQALHAMMQKASRQIDHQLETFGDKSGKSLESSASTPAP